MTIPGPALVALGICGLAAASLVTFTLATVRRAERLVPPDGSFFKLPGGRIHYTDEGSGDAIVLVHGLGGQLRNFARPLVESLAASHRVVAIDRPGSGHSRTIGRYPDLRKQASMVGALIDGLGLGSVVLVGHSLGGALSIALALERPDLIRALALVAPLTRMQEDAPPAFRILTIRSAVLRRLLGWTIVAPFGRFAGKDSRRPVFSPDPVPEDFETRGGGALVYRPSGFDAASRDLLGVPTALPMLATRYGTIRPPVSVLFGRGDRILDPGTNGSAFVAEVPGATLDVIDGGHMLPFTRPIETAAWIAGVAERAGPTAGGGDFNDHKKTGEEDDEHGKDT